MRARESHVHLKSLQSAFALLRPGECLTICAESSDIGKALLSPLILSRRGSPKPLLIYPTQAIVPELTVSVRDSVSLSGAKTPTGAANLINQLTSSLVNGSFAIIDISDAPGKWFRSERNQRAFLDKTAKSFEAKGIRSMWLISRDVLTPKSIAQLKDNSALFMEVVKNGSYVYGQFTAARQRYCPEFFHQQSIRLRAKSVDLKPVEKPSEQNETPSDNRATFELPDSDGNVKRSNSHALKIMRLLPQSQVGSKPGSVDLEVKKLIDRSPYPTAVFSMRKLVAYNNAFHESFSWLGDLKSLTLAKMFGKGNIAIARELSRFLATPNDDSYMWRRDVGFVKPDGELSEYEFSAVPLTWRQKDAIQCMFVNVTARSNIIRGLKASDARYKTLLQNSIEALSLSRGDKIIFVNEAFLRIFNYPSPDDVTGRPLTILGATRKDKSIVSEFTERALQQSGVSHRYEFDATTADGNLLKVEASVLRLDSEEMGLTFLRDITERKHTEEFLQRKLARMDVLLDIAEMVHSTVELDELMRSGLHSCLKGLGMNLGAVYTIDPATHMFVMKSNEGMAEDLVQVLRVQPPDEGIAGYVAKTMEPVVLSTSDYPPFLPYKSLFDSHHLRTVVYIPLIVKANLRGILLLASTKDKHWSEEELIPLSSIGRRLGAALENAMLYGQLKESEEKYRSAVENISAIIYRASRDGSIQYISPGVERLLGFTAEDFYSVPDLWRTLIHPDERDSFDKRLLPRPKNGDEMQSEYRMLPKGKAAYKWLRDSVRYIHDNRGNLVFMSGVVSEITDQRLLTDSLMKSEEMKSNVLESIQEGVVVYDTHFRCIDWNKAMEQITGISRAAVLGRTVSEGSPQFANEAVLALLRRALRGDVEGSDYIPFRARDTEEPGELWVRFSPLRESDGTIVGVVGIITDVTNRRRLERDLRESEQTLRNVIDAMGDALMISDLQGKVWEVNREFSRVTGFQRGEVLGMTFPYPWLIEEEMSKFVQWISELRQRSYLRDFDMTWKRKDGHTLAISLNTTLLLNALGEPVAMLNIGRDISDRKRLAMQLQRKNHQIELLNRIISHANTTLESGKIFEIVANEVGILVPFESMSVALLAEDGTLKPYYTCTNPVTETQEGGSLYCIDQSLEQLALRKGTTIVKGVNHDLEESIEHKSNTVQSQITIPFILGEKTAGVFSVASSEDNAFTNEELTILQPVADQIGAMIDRVRLFQMVSDDSKYIYNLLNSIDSVVYTVDNNYTITQVNNAWHDFAVQQDLNEFADRQSIIGRSLKEIIRDAELWKLYEQVMRDLFKREKDYYSREFQVNHNGENITYHLAINPMVINDKVTALVFTHTDITDVKRTEAEIKRRNKELIALNTISTSITTSLQLDEVLRVAAEQITSAIGADVVLFYLLDEQKGQLLLARFLGISEENAQKIRILDTSSTLTGIALSERHPIQITGTLDSDTRLFSEKRDVFRSVGATSLIAVPLQSKDRVLGAMDVAFEEHHRLDDQEQQLLSLIGNQIGAAIENAQLYSEVQAQVQRITALYELGKALTGVLDLKTLFQMVYGEISKTLPVARLQYHMYSEDTDSLILVTEIMGEQKQFFVPYIGMKDHQGSRDPILLQVVQEGRAFMGASDEESGDAILAAPMRSKERVVGVLSITSDRGLYAEPHLRLFESIANLTGIAIDKAMLYEDTLSKSVEIESRNRELDDFTYVVSHDLKEPLISIEGYSKILLKDYKDTIDTEGKEHLTTVVQSASRMKNLIDDLLTLSRLGRVSEAQEMVSVGEIVNEILYDLQFTLRDRNVTVHVAPSLPTVRYNATRLSMVFRNLISNAMKFNDKPNPRIEIGGEEDDHEYKFSIADNGIGIEKQYFERIFTIFQRLKRSEEFRGTGAGLTIVKKIVEKERGRIWVDSTMGMGSTFFFTIPK